MGEIVKEFSDQDIISGKHHCDLGIFGDLYATKVVFDTENPYFVKIVGTLKTLPKHLQYEDGILVGEPVVIEDAEIVAEISSMLNFTEEDIEKLNAGDIISFGWDNWTTNSIPPEWDY